MTLDQFIIFGATLSGLVASVVESMKYAFIQAWFDKLRKRYEWDDATQHKYYVATLTVLSIAVGIFVALGNGADANILVQLGYVNVHPVIGIIVTGFFLAFGDQFWHELFNLLKALATYNKMKAEALMQSPRYTATGAWSRPTETK